VTGLSFSQACKRYGFNASHVKALLSEGVLHLLPGCSPLRPKISTEVLERLVEGEHFILCRACGSRQAQITTKHLRACSGMVLAEYQEVYPDAPDMCALARENKAKSETQKRAQSEKLKARFQTSAGDKTRQRISEASRARTPQLRETLAEVRERPEVKEKLRQAALRGWASDGAIRKGVQAYHEENREEVIQQLEKARSCVDPEHLRTMAKAREALSTTSGLHLRFKERMVEAGLSGFETEGRVGPFEVDELHRDKRLAIEIDGCYWHGCEECGHPGVPSTISNDRSKNAYLKAAGVRLLRLPGHLIRKHPDEALRLVGETLSCL
jgi:very-short-patch-repair endonuclease